MTKNEINAVVDQAFESSFKNWSRAIENELYPDAFADEYSWIRVKNAIALNNTCLKESLKQTLSSLLRD